MKTNHWELCEAPICANDFNKEYKTEVIWYAGEEVCQKKPYQLFQKRQSKINRWNEKGLFRNPQYYFTANDLEARSALSKGMKGKDPDKDIRSLKKKTYAVHAPRTEEQKAVLRACLKKYHFTARTK